MHAEGQDEPSARPFERSPWDRFALARGASLAALFVPWHMWLREEQFTRGIGVLTIAMLLLCVALAANALFGALETCVSLLLAVSACVRWRSGRAMAALHLKRSVARAACAALPVVVFAAGHRLALGDRVFLWRHGADLEATVRDGVAPKDTFMETWREGPCTVILVCEVDVGDCYWILHDPTASLLTPGALDDDGFLRHRRGSIRHVWGPWYAMVS